MKKKLFILSLLSVFLYTVLPGISSMKAETGTSTTVTNDLPSNVYLQKEKRSLGADYGQSMLTNKGTISPYAAGDDDWDDNGGWDSGGIDGGWGDTDGGNVGGPIGDISLPILFSLIVLYFGYRKVTTSRRRNNI